MYGEGVVTAWVCQKWLVKFCAGNFLLDNAPQSDRPVEVDSNQIETKGSMWFFFKYLINKKKIK